MLSTAALSLPERASKHYAGTNRGTHIGPVNLGKPDEEWQATVKHKRDIYGKKHRIAVGGKSPEGTPEARNDGDWEPVFWWSLPLKFYEELLHRSRG